MPVGNPIRYMKNAIRGKGTSAATASARSSARSSGAAASSRLSKVTNYVKANPKRSALMGGAALGGYGMIRGRRSSGLDKTRGRPTGMYGY